jgi:hypothetical protein
VASNQCHYLLDWLAQSPTQDTAVADAVGTVLAVAVAAMRAGGVNPARDRSRS